MGVNELNHYFDLIDADEIESLYRFLRSTFGAGTSTSSEPGAKKEIIRIAEKHNFNVDVLERLREMAEQPSASRARITPRSQQRARGPKMARKKGQADQAHCSWIDLDLTEIPGSVIDLFADSDAKKSTRSSITYFGPDGLRREMKVRVNGKYWPDNTMVMYPPCMWSYVRNTSQGAV